MERPRKLGRRNLFKQLDEWRADERARKIAETAERSRQVPRPDEADEEPPAESDEQERGEQ